MNRRWSAVGVSSSWRRGKVGLGEKGLSPTITDHLNEEIVKRFRK